MSCRALAAGRRPAERGAGFTVTVPRWRRGSQYVARLSVPGSVYFLVHPQVQGKWKANRGLSDRRNATCAATARLLKDGREFRCSTLFIDLPKTRCFGGRITQVGFLTPHWFSPFTHGAGLTYPMRTVGPGPGTYTTFKGFTKMFSCPLQSEENNTSNNNDCITMAPAESTLVFTGMKFSKIFSVIFKRGGGALIDRIAQGP